MLGGAGGDRKDSEGVELLKLPRNAAISARPVLWQAWVKRPEGWVENCCKKEGYSMPSMLLVNVGNWAWTAILGLEFNTSLIGDCPCASSQDCFSCHRQLYGWPCQCLTAPLLVLVKLTHSQQHHIEIHNQRGILEICGSWICEESVVLTWPLSQMVPQSTKYWHLESIADNPWSNMLTGLHSQLKSL